MSREKRSLSRRQLLASAGTVGALSTVSGVGTWALLEDRELFTGSMAAGEVGVTLGCEESCIPTGDGSVAFELDGLEPADEDDGSSETFTKTFTVTADANPVRAWLRTNCPDPVDPLGDAVEVRLYENPDCEEDDDTSQMYPDDDSDDDSWATLNEFRTDLRSGRRLDDGSCLDGTLCLDLEYRLRHDATGAVGLSTELTFEVVAEQCRHVPESDMATSPFPPEDCPELDCPDCVELGRVNVPNNQLVPGQTYGFEGSSVYEIEVLSVTNKDDGDKQETVCASFALLANGSEANAPPMCSVAVKGGKDTATYPIEPPSTRTTEELCSPADGNSSPGALPAISNIVISVCGETEDPGDDCAICRDHEGERVNEATFSYAGPNGVDVLFDQQSSGEGNGGSQEQKTGVDDGGSFMMSLNGDGSPDFEVSVREGEDDDWTPLTVPLQSDSTSALHTSCSEPFEIGMQLVDDDGTYTLTVESALNKDGEQLCEVSD